VKYWVSKFLVVFLALVTFSAISTPAKSKSKHNRKHAKHVAAVHHSPKHHKAPKHA
jgi:hypothetical protein